MLHVHDMTINITLSTLVKDHSPELIQTVAEKGYHLKSLQSKPIFCPPIYLLFLVHPSHLITLFIIPQECSRLWYAVH